MQTNDEIENINEPSTPNGIKNIENMIEDLINAGPDAVKGYGRGKMTVMTLRGLKVDIESIKT
jgi:hypothetical protein